MPIHFYEDNANKIIPGLFLGNYLASQSSKFIDNNKIKAIVNLTPDFPNTFDNKIDYLRIPVQNKKEYIKIFESYLPLAYKFIDQYIENNKNVLVHCKAGHRRSVSLIVYYLMKKYGFSRKIAFDYIKEIRPTIHNSENKIVFYNSLK